ncbi:F-box/kelch-repeat protein-like protein [Tanacetum coccineum]
MVLLEELVEDILLRLAVEDLTRYKIVCKSWYSLISSPSFVKLHLKINGNNRRHLRILMPWYWKAVDKISNKSLYEFNSWRVVGSSNGLVCFSRIRKDDLTVINNPCTREVTKLPMAPSLPAELSDLLTMSFGYDSYTDDYKVVMAIEKGLHESLVQVLSLKSNTWKLIGQFKYLFCHSLPGILCNGAFHWFVFDYSDNANKNSNRVILSFDLSQEEFTAFPEPNDKRYESSFTRSRGNYCLMIARSNARAWKYIIAQKFVPSLVSPVYVLTGRPSQPKNNKSIEVWSAEVAEGECPHLQTKIRNFIKTDEQGKRQIDELYRREVGEICICMKMARQRGLYKEFPNMSGQSTEGDNEDEASSTTSKRQRSLVSSCFEKIEGATPADRTASCHNCGKVYCANPGSGTRNLKRHMLKCFNIQEGEPPQKRAPLKCFNNQEVIMAIPDEDGISYTKEVIKVEYEWRPSRCADCKIFGHSCDRCPKIVREPVVSISKDTNSDGFTEVKGKKHKGKKADIQPRSRQIDGIRLDKPKPNFYQQKKGRGANMDSTTKVGDNAINKVKGPSTSNSFDALNTTDVEEECGTSSSIGGNPLPKKKKLHQFLHRDTTPICRNSAKKDMLPIYEREKTNLKMKLEKVSGRISFTADLWSSITSDGYMALTAHYVDETWVLRKKGLNFSFVPPPHKGKMLAYVLKNGQGLGKLPSFLNLSMRSQPFSGNSYPTSNLYFFKVFKIQSNIEEVIRNSDPVISDMGKDMKMKFDKYWNDYCKVLMDDIVDSLHELYEDYEFNYETMHDSLGDGNEHANESEARNESDEFADFESFPSRFRRAETTNKS